jgi:hypothetical protein
VIINTRDLTGKGLDWAVAEAISLPMKSHDDVEWPDDAEWIAEHDGLINQYTEYHNHSSMNRRYDKTPFSPSVDWSQCGPLIGEFIEDMSIQPGNIWMAVAFGYFTYHRAESPQIAICRAVVAAKLGEIVAIPDGLCDAQEEAK